MKRKKSLLQNYLAWEDFGLVCRKQLHSSPLDTPGQHSHADFYELVIVSAGKGLHQIFGKEFELTPGCVFLVPINTVHCYREYNNLLIFNLLFSRKFVRFFLNDLTNLEGFQLIFNMRADEAMRSSSDGIRINEHIFPEIVRILEEMNDLNESIEPGVKTELLSLFIRVMLLLARHSRWSGPPKQLLHIGQLASLMTELEKRYSEPWTLEKMAKFTCMSVSAFRQEFRKIAGYPPVEYLLHLRLEHAFHLLEQHSHSLSEAAFLCGFADVNYFSRQFRKRFGVPPSRV